MSQLIETDIVINAPIERVWKLLTDLTSYTNWNPFIVQASGNIELHQTLKCQPKMPGGRKYTFEPVVTRCEPFKEFAWRGNVIHPTLASGEHIFKIVEVGENQVRLLHNEIFSGILSPLYVPFVRDSTIKGFELMNKALKYLAESTMD